MRRESYSIGAREICEELISRRSRHGGYGDTEREDLVKEYTEEEMEFLIAMTKWMQANRCKFPLFTDCLFVLKSLGYKR